VRTSCSHIGEKIGDVSENIRNLGQHIGFTAAAIMELARGFNIPVHVMWGHNKIDSFVPERSQYETVALYIWGNHLFTVGDVQCQQAIARQKI
jgi:hypothetical protein